MKDLGFIAILIIFIIMLPFLGALPFKWMWNYAVVSAITIAQPIGYWTAFCLMMFLSIFMVGSRSSTK